MKNIKLEIKENIMTIEVDLSQDFGKSKSGKTTIIASSEGNQPISNGDDVVYLGLNIYKMSELSDDLFRLGFQLYPGCRIEAVKHADELGISIEEILLKFSDADVLEAIHESARVMGLLSVVKCAICDEVIDENDAMECDCCGEIFCDNCGEFPGERNRYCGISCALECGWQINDKGGDDSGNIDEV